MQFQADLLGIPVVRPKVIETTALGAAYLAGLSSGVFTGLPELAAQWAVERRFLPTMDRSRAQELMWKKVGLIRRAADLKVAITECEALLAENVNQRTKNFATLAKLMAEAALWREESRGGHFRADFPARNDEQWDKHSAQTSGQETSAIEKISEE